MSIAISEDHKALADTVSDFLRSKGARADARALLEASTEPMPTWWSDVANLGWTGLHLPETHGGSGYGLEELAVVVEEFGRVVAPGPFVPSVLASALIASVGTQDLQATLLPGFADGSKTAGVGLGGAVTVTDAKAHGSAGVVLGAGLANVLVVACGDDVAVIDGTGTGVTIETPANLDPTRRSSRVTLNGAPATLLIGARGLLNDLARTILSAEAVGVARECTDAAAKYSKERFQFGRVIATYQAVKHHCANMAVATELATAAVWDAARAASKGGDQFSFTAATAATLAGPAADLCANLSTQVYGGIGITWEHDAHLLMRRATALRALLDPETAAVRVTDLTRSGVRRERTVNLPPEAEPIRETVKAFVDSVKGLDETAQRDSLITSGYVMPHWPTPWGRGAGAIEQLVIEQEFAAAAVKRPQYGITGWVILTLIQYGTDDQVKRWVPSALSQEIIWCQLFSEPDAGSDAAGIKTKATRVAGGWLINGQKVWTSGAHVAGRGFATVRTNPDVPKHQGITMVVIDMKGEGVEVRPLKMTSGHSEFNEVFFNDAFVPDDDVVGPVDGGWTVARATLGNESVSIGGGQGGMALPVEVLIGAFDASPARLAGGSSRIGRYASTSQAMSAMNLRSANRAVAGNAPGPEGNITKLVLSENGHEAAAMLSALMGPEAVFVDGASAIAGGLTLMHRGLSIAGGTSEIKRNQIGERILGLPRDPLIN